MRFSRNGVLSERYFANHLQRLIEDNNFLKKIPIKFMKIRQNIRAIGKHIKRWLERLSFRTGVIVLVMCVPFYIISFAQMALPLNASIKGVLWFIFFGLAKTAQYGGLTIIGAEGVKRLKKFFTQKKLKKFG